MIKKSFKEFVQNKGGLVSEAETTSDPANKDWRKQYIQLEKGFIPPPKMRPIIEAFLKSGEIQIMDDTSKGVTLPKKSLFLTGGSVRDFLKGKSSSDYHLATNATPAQIALILHASGFRMAGNAPQGLKLTFTPRPAEEGSKRIWSVDKSGIVASVNGEAFTVETLRKDPKTGAAGKEFVDNPIDDANTRDLTINALYIELSKADGENGKLYDPTQRGWHDVNNGVVRMVGKAEDRLREDPSRLLRVIRFHSRFSKNGDLDPEIRRALERFKNLDGVQLTKVRDEFLKGLLHPDTNLKRYIQLYQETGLINKLFPDMQINTEIPPQFSTRRDKPLALAWLLQNNPVDQVATALSFTRETNGESVQTGWSDQEKRAVLYLLALKQFTPQDRPKFLKDWKGTGLSQDQIRDWVDMFQFTDGQGRVRNRRPVWANHVRTFADNDKPLAGEKDVAHLPKVLRGQALDQMEISRFADKLPKKEEA
jgi:tRNA nucleotidyltransferase/poly(A) polymerase